MPPLTGWMKLALAVALLALLFGGGQFYRLQEQKIRQQVEQGLIAVVHLKADRISAWRQRQLQYAAVLQEDQSLIRHAARFMADPHDENAVELRTRFSSMARFWNFSDVMLVAVDGKVHMSLTGKTELAGEGALTLESAMKDHKPSLGELREDAQDPTPHISVSAPLFMDEGPAARLVGTLILVCDASRSLFPLIQSWPTLAKTAETVMVRRDGDDALFLNDLRYKPGSALKLRIPLSRTDVPAVMAVLGREGVFEGKDYRGIDVVSVIAPVPDSLWFMVAKMDKSEAFADWRIRSILILAVIAVLVGTTIILWFFIIQLERKANYRMLYRSEAALRAAMERHSVTLQSIGDAVIATDSMGRVELLNAVAEMLTGWSHEEARGRPLTEVFRIVNEQTLETVENPAARALREGLIVGLANHTLLIGRDGTQRPIADSAAPIRDHDGTLTGVVLIFRDQTSERMAQRLVQTRLDLIEYAAAHTMDEFLSKALDTIGALVDSPIGFYHFVESDQKTISKQQWSTRTLKEFCSAEGKGKHYDVEQAGVWADCLRQKKPTIHNDYNSLKHKKGMPEGHAKVVRELAVPVMRESKVVAIMGVGNKPADYTEKDAETVAYLADVTWEIVDLKRSNEILRESHARLDLALRSADMGTWYWDIIENRRHFSNQTCHLLGIDPEKFTGTAWEFFNAVHPDDREKIRATLAQTIEKNVPYEVEYRAVWPDAIVHYLVARGSLVRGDEGEPVRLNGVVYDATQRVQAEEALKESRQQLANIIDFLPDATFVINTEGRVIAWNHAIEEMTGVKATDMLGKGNYEYALPFYGERKPVLIDLALQSKPEIEKRYNGFERKATAISGEAYMPAMRGGQVFLYGTASALFDSAGNVVGAIESIRDITERRRMEEALTESQTKLHEAHKLARIGIWEWITDSDTVYWSDELYEIAGRDRKLPAPAFREQSNLYTRQGWDRLSAAVEQALKTGTSYELELEMIRPDGASRWIKAFGGRKNDGAETALRLYGTVQDITEIKSVELELVESERRYRTLFEEAIDGVVLADLATGEIIECNRAFLELTGYERHELIGTSQAALLPDGDLDSGLSHTFPQYKGGAGLITELATRSGTIKQVEIKGSPIEIASRKIMQAFFRDMTSELRYQSERETSLKLLELMNSGDNTRELIRSLTGYIQDWTGCAAVGVRLREGDDFPYFETRGFPPDFVLAENSLCALDASGRIVRDGAGNPVLECMCGNILRGRFNPGLPFFTPKGSFWTNCTTELLASTSEADRQARTRNRCNGEGYESVALIPLRVGSDTLGLLQINDGRKDRFTPELIHFLENTADQIAMALAQRQARAELRTSEQRFRSVSESIGEFIWEVDTKGQFTFVSDRVESVLGYRPEDLLGKRDCFIADESDAARCRSFRRERMQAKEGFRDFEYLGRTKPGSPVWLSSSGSPILGPKNRLLGFRGATLDITERKLAERSIRLSEEKYRRLFEDAVLGIFRSTVDGKIIEVNPAYARMFGFSSPEETKSQVNDVAIDLYVDPARRNEIVRMVHDAKGPVHAEILYKRKDGSTFTGNLHLWEVRDRSENLYLEGFIEDITERKRAEEEKEKLEAQLLQAQKLEAIGTLAGGIAHDFNNILSPIIGYAQMALDDLPHSNPMRFGQEQIMASGLRAKDLVKQILAFGRPGEGQRKEPVAVSSIVKEAIKLLRASLPSSIKIVHRIENCTAKVDPTQIHQVLMNLCTNAAHAMNNRGILEIRLSNVHLSESDLTGQSIVHLKPGLHLKLSVSDSGSGMDKPTLERIFDPFFTTKAVGKGTGLGLAVVHGIVKHHDGAVTVQSEVGKGSIFNIYIPAVEHGVRMAGETGPSRSGGAERVLLIDDEESIIQMETAMLKGLGYKVTPETNSLHSLEIFRSRPGEFDLVITDQTMPDLTGIELIKEIRRIRADIPMILCTGFSEEVTEETAIALNAEFIMKPFTKAQFAEIIRKVLDAKES